MLPDKHLGFKQVKADLPTLANIISALISWSESSLDRSCGLTSKCDLRFARGGRPRKMEPEKLTVVIGESGKGNDEDEGGAIEQFPKQIHKQSKRLT